MLASDISSPPRSIVRMYGPTTGTEPAICVPTFVAKNESSFQGNRYPVKPNPMTRKNSPEPVTQVNSRGGLYAFRKNVEKRCTKAESTIRLADQEWIERISQPNSTFVIMNFTDSNASAALGL